MARARNEVSSIRRRDRELSGGSAVGRGCWGRVLLDADGVLLTITDKRGVTRLWGLHVSYWDCASGKALWARLRPNRPTPKTFFVFRASTKNSLFSPCRGKRQELTLKNTSFELTHRPASSLRTHKRFTGNSSSTTRI